MPPSTEEINRTQQHHELFPTHTGVMHGAFLHKNALIGFTTHAYSFKRLALLRLPRNSPFSPDLMRSCALHTHAHLTSQHRLSCHLELYLLEFEFLEYLKHR